jgi:hypothetical protein
MYILDISISISPVSGKEVLVQYAQSLFRIHHSIYYQSRSQSKIVYLIYRHSRVRLKFFNIIIGSN